MGRWLWYANVAALSGLLLRFAVIKLHKIYRFVFAYFVAEAGASLLLTWIPFDSNSYAYVYMTVRAAMNLLAILAVLEIYGITLAGHPGLASFGRGSVLSVTALAIAIAGASTFLDKDVPPGQSAILHRFFTIERTLDLMIIVFLMLFALFIMWFPIRMSRNAALSIGGFSVYYFSRVGGLLAVNLFSRAHLPAINDVFLAISVLLIMIWTFVLRPEKQSSDVVTGHFWNPAEMERLSRQLDTVNAALVRFGRH